MNRLMLVTRQRRRELRPKAQLASQPAVAIRRRSSVASMMWFSRYRLKRGWMVVLPTVPHPLLDWYRVLMKLCECEKKDDHLSASR
jgi:hypothetical protein